MHLISSRLSTLSNKATDARLGGDESERRDFEFFNAMLIDGGLLTETRVVVNVSLSRTHTHVHKLNYRNWRTLNKELSYPYYVIEM